MRSVKSLIAAGAASLLSSMAFAADMTIAPPPMYVPPSVEDFGGWYLRGDIGFSNQRVKRLSNVLDAGNTTSVQNLGFNTAGIFGLGLGYKVNNWFRADVTGEYRGNSQFFGTDLISFPGGFGAHTYHATKSESLALANAYVDLGTWWGVTPFVGAGAGAARGLDCELHRFRRHQRRRTAGASIRRKFVEMEFRLGASCRCCLQGLAEFYRRTRISLSRYGRRPDRRSQGLRRHQQHRQSDDVQGPYLA